MYLLTKLNDQSLKEAVESLSDIYHWQMESEQVKVTDPKVQYIGSFKPKSVEREPFSIER